MVVKTTLRKSDPKATIKGLQKKQYRLEEEARGANPYVRQAINKQISKNISKQQAIKSNANSKVNKDLSKSLGSVASNKGIKKADVKGTVKLAEKNLSDAKQKLRTFDRSMHNLTLNQIEQQHRFLKKQAKTAEKNLKSLNKTASKRK